VDQTAPVPICISKSKQIRLDIHDNILHYSFSLLQHRYRACKLPCSAVMWAQWGFLVAIPLVAPLAAANSHYATLGVESTASHNEIKKAYRQQVREFPPSAVHAHSRSPRRVAIRGNARSALPPIQPPHWLRQPCSANLAGQRSHQSRCQNTIVNPTQTRTNLEHTGFEMAPRQEPGQCERGYREVHCRC
jgi:hypothetical protein